jgi:hypothetical protein
VITLDPSLKLSSGQRAAFMGTASDSRPLRAQLSPETGFVSGHPLAKFWKKQPGECSRPLAETPRQQPVATISVV